MLKLTRRAGDGITIWIPGRRDPVEITIAKTTGTTVTVLLEADPDIRIARTETQTEGATCAQRKQNRHRQGR